MNTIEVTLTDGPQVVRLGTLGWGVPFTLVAPREEKEQGVICFQVNTEFLSGGATVETKGQILVASLAGGLHTLSHDTLVIVRDIVANER